LKNYFYFFFYLFSFDRQLWIANNFYLTRFKKVAQCRKKQIVFNYLKDASFILKLAQRLAKYKIGCF
jgi:hypothetical protein